MSAGGNPNLRPTGSESKLVVGTKLGGQYRITGIVGEGGLGKIYLARQEPVERDVAVKFLPAALAADQSVVKRMAREAKALARLDHPNIVTTYDFGFTERREPYLVLALVKGETLQAKIDRDGAMPHTECVPLFMQLADAMQYAHSNGIVHRDLKPQNIMVTQEGGKLSCKILDFGIAQMESEAQKITLSGEIWGSPHYMSPEQCTAEPVDHLTDIYSLGILMYCTLSTKLPHKGTEFAEVVSQKLWEPVPTFAILDVEKPIDVPLGLERIVFKCLKRKKEERYQSMEEVKAALEAFITKVRSGRVTRPSMSRANLPPLPKPSSGNKPERTFWSKLTSDRPEKNILFALAFVTTLILVALIMFVGQAIGPR